MNLISSRLHIFLLSPVTSASLNLRWPIASVSSLPFICFVAPIILSGLVRVFQDCLAGWKTCKKMQIWVTLNLCMRICNWREQGNVLPESLSWKRWNCYLQHKKWVMRTGDCLPAGWRPAGGLELCTLLWDKTPLLARYLQDLANQGFTLTLKGVGWRVNQTQWSYKPK